MTDTSAPGTLQRLNTHVTGYVGVVAGGTSLLAAIAGFFKLVADPKYLVALFVALIDARHNAVSSQDQYVFAQFVGACIAIFGGLILGFVACYYGRPKT